MSKWLGRLMAFMGIFGFIMADQALALTAAGVDISNRASVGYSVNSNPQTAVLSDFDTDGDGDMDLAGPTIFKVDRKIDLTVLTQDGALASGANGSVVSRYFRVTNTSNETLRFTLAASNGLTGALDPWAGGVNDTLEAQSFAISSEETQDSNSFSGANVLVNVPAGEFRDVKVDVTLPAIAASGSIGVIYLTATATETDGTAINADTGSNTYNLKDTVRADGDGPAPEVARDSAHSDDSAFVVTSATITVTKSVSVFNSGAGLPSDTYAIPGAVMTYSIVISNAAGGQLATGINLVDQIPTNTSFVVGSVTGGAATTYENAPLPFGAGQPDWTYVPVGAAGAIDPAVTAIRVGVADVAAAGSATITFKVQIN